MSAVGVSLGPLGSLKAHHRRTPERLRLCDAFTPEDITLLIELAPNAVKLMARGGLVHDLALTCSFDTKSGLMLQG